MKIKRGISKNVPHTYIQSGVRYYALLREVEVIDDNDKKVSATNFYIFDHRGYVWLQMTHTTEKFIYQLGGGVLRNQTVLEVDDNAWDTRPIVASDEWVNGSADRGYALEIIREGLGLKLEYLTALMDEDTEERLKEV